MWFSVIDRGHDIIIHRILVGSYIEKLGLLKRGDVIRKVFFLIIVAIWKKTRRPVEHCHFGSVPDKKLSGKHVKKRGQ